MARLNLMLKDKIAMIKQNLEVYEEDIKQMKLNFKEIKSIFNKTYQAKFKLDIKDYTIEQVKDLKEFVHALEYFKLQTFIQKIKLDDNDEKNNIKKTFNNLKKFFSIVNNKKNTIEKIHVYHGRYNEINIELKLKNEAVYNSFTFYF